MNKPIFLFIGSVWPEPNSSAAGTRTMQLISILRHRYKIVFACPAADSEFAEDIESLGIIKKNISLNSSDFDNYIQQLNPSIVLFDRFNIEEQFGWRITKNCPDALRILDTIDLHCLRLSRQQAFKERREFSNDDLFSETAKREIASILRCDLSLLVSDFEMDLLKSTFKIDPTLLYYLPLLVDNLHDSVLNFSSRKDFVFIGNFLHEPNWNAVQYLKESIWPLIHKELPTTNLKIYGAYPSQKVLQLHNPKSNFLIMGRAQSASEVIGNAKVLLAPLRFGAGIKGKLLEAMELGTPSVTTAIGSEGMNGELEWNGSICDEATDFASKSVELYTDESVWGKSQERGFTILKNRFSKDIFVPGFLNTLLKIKDNLKGHRLNNFFGAILNHHTLRSTEYMSRWIEEKNKK